MAQLNDNTCNRSSKSRQSKSCKTDLTPMVDLGFLLITFFILSTVLTQPTATKLVMPKESVVKTPVRESAVLSIQLTGNDSIAWYDGNRNNGVVPTYCALGNLRAVIQSKREEVGKRFGDPSETIVVIYPGPECTYKNFIAVLDEITINGVSHYFVMNTQSKGFIASR